MIIARGKKLVARLVSVDEVSRKRQPSSLKGKLQVGPEFFEPLPANMETDEIYNFLGGKGGVTGDVVLPAFSPKARGKLK